MAGNPFDNPTMSIMYRDALQSLSAGAVMPWDRDILAIAPLPADVVDPFASQDVDPLQIMGFTYNSLVTWIDEARKANYFSKRFTDLSKLVLKGVMTMGRGLITLHNRGEDLSRAPMQIGDLISVGSYHFRKSYLGVIQTAKSHPEISERLLLNQLSWTNMLLRLYKTKEKLADNKKSEIRNKKSDSGTRIEDQGSRLNEEGKALPNEEGRNQNDGLPDGNSDNATFLTLNSSLDKDDAHAFSDVDTLFEPAALSAPRALMPMRNAGCGVRSNTECGIRNAEDKVSGVSSNEEIRQKTESDPRRGADSEANCRKFLNEETGSGAGAQVSGAGDSGTRIEDQGTSLNEEEKSTENEERRTSENKKSEIKNKKSEAGVSNQVSGIRSNEEDNSSIEELTDGNSDNSSFLPLHSSLDDDSSSDDDLPSYLQILRNAFGRSEPNDEGRVTFTYDEIRYLASDPEFARIYPETAADMRKIQQQIDTG